MVVAGALAYRSSPLHSTFCLRDLMKPLVSARGEHLGCVLAKLTDHSHGDLLAFLYLKGSADVAVGTGKGFVVELDL